MEFVGAVEGKFTLRVVKLFKGLIKHPTFFCAFVSLAMCCHWISLNCLSAQVPSHARYLLNTLCFILACFLLFLPTHALSRLAVIFQFSYLLTSLNDSDPLSVLRFLLLLALCSFLSYIYHNTKLWFASLQVLVLCPKNL